MAKYYLLPFDDGATILGSAEIARRYDHNADETLVIIESTTALRMAKKNKCTSLLVGKKTITQSQREAYVREWNPIESDEDLE